MIFAAIVLYLIAGLTGQFPQPSHQVAFVLELIALILIVGRFFVAAGDPRYGRWL